MNTRLIQGAGWNAVVAKDGVEAIEMLQAGEGLPNVILTDVEMPRMDGYELLSSIKKNDRWKDIPVVMITSRAGDKHRQKAVELGASEYLVKPYDDAKLLEIVRDLTAAA
jgi:chemosensory pili system protein ChpA (sensor histidine kinase/response regulator)